MVVRNIRSQLKPGEVLCEHCTSLCCRYYSLHLATPKTWDDFDNIRWYLAHGGNSVYVDAGNWYLMVHGDCRYLLPDNRCGIYQNRPKVCADYTTEACEFDNEFVFDKFFEVPEQIWEFAEAILPPRKPRDSSLPILSSV